MQIGRKVQAISMPYDDKGKFRFEPKELDTIEAHRPVIDPELVYEYIVEQLEAKIEMREGKARQHVIDFLVQTEAKISIIDILGQIANKYSLGKNVVVDNSDRADELEKQYAEKGLIEEDTDEIELTEINRPVSHGGVTLLMVHAIDGDLDKCKIAVAEGADVKAKDNSRMTAQDHALFRGNFEIAEYLKSILDNEDK